MGPHKSIHTKSIEYLKNTRERYSQKSNDDLQQKSNDDLQQLYQKYYYDSYSLWQKILYSLGFIHIKPLTPNEIKNIRGKINNASNAPSRSSSSFQSARSSRSSSSFRSARSSRSSNSFHSARSQG